MDANRALLHLFAFGIGQAHLAHQPLQQKSVARLARPDHHLRQLSSILVMSGEQCMRFVFVRHNVERNSDRLIAHHDGDGFVH